MRDFEILKIHMEIEMNFITSWYVLYPEHRENYIRRSNIIFSEYMNFIIPFI